MIRNKDSGSGLFIVIFIMSILVIFITNVWRNTTYTYDLVLAKGAYEQQYRQVEGLMNYAIALCKKNYGALYASSSRESTPLVIFLKSWPQNSAQEKGDYSGKICITLLDKGLLIAVELLKDAQEVGKVSCELKKRKNKKDNVSYQQLFSIHNWSIDL